MNLDDKQAKIYIVPRARRCKQTNLELFMLNSQRIKENNQMMEVLTQTLPDISVFAVSIWVFFLKKINRSVIN